MTVYIISSKALNVNAQFHILLLSVYPLPRLKRENRWDYFQGTAVCMKLVFTPFQLWTIASEEICILFQVSVSSGGREEYFYGKGKAAGGSEQGGL